MAVMLPTLASQAATAPAATATSTSAAGAASAAAVYLDCQRTDLLMLRRSDELPFRSALKSCTAAVGVAISDTINSIGVGAVPAIGIDLYSSRGGGEGAAAGGRDEAAAGRLGWRDGLGCAAINRVLAFSVAKKK